RVRARWRRRECSTPHLSVPHPDGANAVRTYPATPLGIGVDRPERPDFSPAGTARRLDVPGPQVPMPLRPVRPRTLRDLGAEVACLSAGPGGQLWTRPRVRRSVARPARGTAAC